jgi:hypothetical protein
MNVEWEDSTGQGLELGAELLMYTAMALWGEKSAGSVGSKTKLTQRGSSTDGDEGIVILVVLTVDACREQLDGACLAQIFDL